MKNTARTPRTCVITGAAGGIGRALVEGFTDSGYRVIALDNAPQPASLACWKYLHTDLQRLVSEPTAIATDMLKAGFANQPAQYAQLESCHPQGRVGTPEEVAALAVAIASGELRFLHGACIGMDGGISGRLHDPG